jgi:hypothetical protein
MYKPMQRNAKLHAEQKVLRLNMDKLQAVACLLASAAVSIALIYWGITAVI